MRKENPQIDIWLHVLNINDVQEMDADYNQKCISKKISGVHSPMPASFCSSDIMYF